MNRTTLSLLMAACAAVTAGSVVAAEPAPAHVVIADKPQPQAKILLYALLPRGKGKTDPSTVRNEKVNAFLPAFCDGKDVFFCDIGAKMLKSDGTIDKEQLEDGLHPGIKGYETWLADVLPRLEKIFNVTSAETKARLRSKSLEHGF